MMKNLFIGFVIWVSISGVFAQSPEKINYQAVIRDTDNNLVAEQKVGMQISIIKGLVSKTVIYVETHSPTTNINGVVSIEIGDGSVELGNFENINWANGTYSVKTETDPLGGTNYTISGTSQLLSVPYALHAKTAENVIGGANETDPVYAVSEAANITASDITNLSNLSGTNTGDQDGSETKITAGTNVTVSGTGTLASPYVINSAGGGAGLTHYVGELYGGGVVFYVDHTGEHGLICSMINIGGLTAWSNVPSTEIGTAAQSEWDGNSNSASITSQVGHTNSAAQLCLNYTNADYGTGIFSDWYLPSRRELILLWNRLYEVQKALDSDGNSSTTLIPNDFFWTSTELDNNNAWTIDFYTGLVDGTFTKDDANYIRAIRSF